MSNLIKTLSGMKFPEKIDHIWTYYKLHIIGGLTVLALLICWGVSIYENSKEVLLQGELMNVTVTDAGYHYLTHDSFQAVGGSHDRQVVHIVSHFVGDPATDSTAYLQQMKLFAQVESKDLDFLILDEPLFQAYALSDFFMNLNDFLTEEEMAVWKDSIVYVDSACFGTSYPAGICLDQTPFAKACFPENTSYYLVLIANTQRLPACRAFWEHILSYKA